MWCVTDVGSERSQCGRPRRECSDVGEGRVCDGNGCRAVTDVSAHDWRPSTQPSDPQPVSNPLATCCPQTAIDSTDHHPYGVHKNGLSPLSLMIKIMSILVLCLWIGHYESSFGLFEECRLIAKRPPTLWPSQQTCAVSTPVLLAAIIYTHRRRLLLLLSPKADTHFTILVATRKLLIVMYRCWCVMC